MKTKQFFLTLTCLLLWVIMGQSNVAQTQESSKTQQDSERHQSISRSFWDGRGTSISTEALLSDREFRAALGVSDKYYQEILASVRNAVGRISDTPEYREAVREYDDAIEALTGRRGMMSQVIPQNADAKALNRFREAAGRMESMAREFARGSSQRHDAAMEEALSSELKQKIQEAWLAAMDETSMFSPRVFEVLNLTDAQKQQMERIKKELGPELEKHLETYGNNAAKILERVNAVRRQPDYQRTIADVGLNAYMRKLEAEPEHKKLLDESYASSKAFATLFRKRMFEILNDEQRKRLQELTDSPPAHARILIQRLKRENWGQHEEGEGKRAGSDKDVWTPGPDSWQPGDPLPEEFRQERDTRRTFPRSTD